MTKIPDCPRCGEDELWFQADLPAYFRLRCYLCGFDSGPRKPCHDMDLDGSIATVVELERVAAVKEIMAKGEGGRSRAAAPKTPLSALSPGRCLPGRRWRGTLTYLLITFHRRATVKLNSVELIRSQVGWHCEVGFSVQTRRQYTDERHIVHTNAYGQPFIGLCRAFVAGLLMAQGEARRLKSLSGEYEIFS